jgi:hypothetical protein
MHFDYVIIIDVIPHLPTGQAGLMRNPSVSRPGVTQLVMVSLSADRQAWRTMDFRPCLPTGRFAGMTQLE